MLELPPPSLPGIESADFTCDLIGNVAGNRWQAAPALLVNIILFSPHEVELPLSRHDPRARHILEVLRRRPGGDFDAGLINGARGKATLQVPPLPVYLRLAKGQRQQTESERRGHSG